MPTTRPTPYLEGKAGDLITAARWNELQIQTREEIAATLAAHEAAAHTGDAQNPQVTALTADSVTAATLTGTTVRATSLTGGTVAADTLSVKNLEVKEGLTLRGTSSGLNAGAPKVWSGCLDAGSGTGGIFTTSLSVSSIQGSHQYYGPYFYTAGNLGSWAGVHPQLSFRLETAGLLKLSASWFNYTSSGNWGWAQFLIGTAGKFAPVRTYSGSQAYCGDWGVGGFSYSRPPTPTATTFATWLDYHWTFYNQNSYRWPLAGKVVYSNNYGSLSHEDCIEVPAGSYTINMGYSGYHWVAGLQLRATFFPGGTTQS